ncbi:MAG TPA: hypothetical protein VGH28_30180 [Polyangiaceae bacterium]
MKRAFVLLAIAACGGRTGLRGEVVANEAGAGASASESTAYKVVYEGPGAGTGFELWRSTTGTLSGFLTEGEHFEAMSCTYDGRFMAAANNPDVTSFDVIDASGKVVRTQKGGLEALRPDGMRAIVAGVHDGCVGTLDADGTYADVRCGNTSADSWGAATYAPDGKTVLWAHEVYDPATTNTFITFATASEQLTDERVVVGPGNRWRFGTATPSFSFDGSRLAYADCKKGYGDDFCKLGIVRLDTLEATAVLDDSKLRFISGVGFTPDGGALVYMATPDPSHPPALRRVDLATGVDTVLADPSHTVNDGPYAFCVARDGP